MNRARFPTPPYLVCRDSNSATCKARSTMAATCSREQRRPLMVRHPVLPFPSRSVQAHVGIEPGQQRHHGVRRQTKLREPRYQVVAQKAGELRPAAHEFRQEPGVAHDLHVRRGEAARGPRGAQAGSPESRLRSARRPRRPRCQGSSPRAATGEWICAASPAIATGRPRSSVHREMRATIRSWPTTGSAH